MLVYHQLRLELRRLAWLLLGLVTIQFTLGALTVLSERQVGINTAHVATGAALLATAVLLALLVHRHRFTDVSLSNASVALPATSSVGVVR